MDVADYRRIVILTGAGISQAAGLPTYRGPGGLWTDPKLAALTDVRALADRRHDVCTMFWQFRQAIAKVGPTRAHRALAAFEERLPGDAVLTIITQNVDGLHQTAGSHRVCEYHGTLARWRCEPCGRELEPPPDADLPTCCNQPMRPAVVMFGELIPTAAERMAKVALRDCDLFVAIGTSGTVAPASSFVRWAALNNARRVLLNLEIFDGARDQFSECRSGPADELVEGMFGPS